MTASPDATRDVRERVAAELPRTARRGAFAPRSGEVANVGLDVRIVTRAAPGQAIVRLAREFESSA